MDGNFIYQLRRLDVEKQLWTLRGDKLFYSFVVFPHKNYTEFVKTEADILETIFRYDPEFIVVEEPKPYTMTPDG